MILGLLLVFGFQGNRQLPAAEAVKSVLGKPCRLRAGNWSDRVAGFPVSLQCSLLSSISRLVGGGVHAAARVHRDPTEDHELHSQARLFLCSVFVLGVSESRSRSRTSSMDSSELVRSFVAG